MKIHWFLWVARHRTVFRGHPKEHETKSTGVPKVVRKTYRKVKRARRRKRMEPGGLLLTSGSALARQEAARRPNRQEKRDQDRPKSTKSRFQANLGGGPERQSRLRRLRRLPQITQITSLSVDSGGLTYDSGSPRGGLTGGERADSHSLGTHRSDGVGGF